MRPTPGRGAGPAWRFTHVRSLQPHPASVTLAVGADPRPTASAPQVQDHTQVRGTPGPDRTSPQLPLPDSGRQGLECPLHVGLGPLPGGRRRAAVGLAVLTRSRRTGPSLQTQPCSLLPGPPPCPPARARRGSRRLPVGRECSSGRLASSSSTWFTPDRS